METKNKVSENDLNNTVDAFIDHADSLMGEIRSINDGNGYSYNNLFEAAQLTVGLIQQHNVHLPIAEATARRRNLEKAIAKAQDYVNALTVLQQNL